MSSCLKDARAGKQRVKKSSGKGERSTGGKAERQDLNMGASTKEALERSTSHSLPKGFTALKYQTRNSVGRITILVMETCSGKYNCQGSLLSKALTCLIPCVLAPGPILLHTDRIPCKSSPALQANQNFHKVKTFCSLNISRRNISPILVE